MRCRKDIRGGGTTSAEGQICARFFSCFERKQGHGEGPEVALQLILEVVGVGELALGLGEDTGGHMYMPIYIFLYKAGVWTQMYPREGCGDPSC